ncbi:hypothetical protein [Catellatospora sp. NPDC049133]|uniref:hypothetical protein n=1 Tax=Catellatospora sp. NPDC049133 TaxID=3155499 RepID=UPI00340ED1A7
MTAYLVILGHRDAIRWVLSEERMAFPATPRAEVRALAPGDRLYLYATRGAWLNPTRDRGRIIAVASAATAVRVLDEPVEIAGRTFMSGCDLKLDDVVPYPGGLELQPLVSQMEAFPKPEVWSIYLRRALLRLSERDARLLDQQLVSLLASAARAVPSYAQTVRSH